MDDLTQRILDRILKRLQEESSTGGSATFNSGEGIQYASKNSFKPNKYRYKLPDGYKFPIKEESDDYSEFQNERIDSFKQIEKELNSLFPLLSNAKNQTIKYYSEKPGSFEVVVSTDLILDYIKDIKTLLNEE